MSKTADSTSSNRIPWIDMARGLGIILVMAGHMTSHLFGDSPIGGWIYSFHMPLFFFLSGYLFSARKPFGAFLKHKVQTLIIPYFLLGIPLAFADSLRQWLEVRGLIGVSFSSAVEATSYSSLLLGNLRGLLIQNRQWAIWFIAVLFLTEIFFYILRRLIRNDITLTLCCICITALGLIYYHFGGRSLPWDLDMVPVALFFYAAGHISRKIGLRQILTSGSFGRSENNPDNHFDQDSLMRRHIFRTLLVCICLWMLNILCLHLTWRISGNSLEMFFMLYGCPPLTLLSALFGVFAACLTAALLTQLPGHGVFRRVHRALSYIGAHSLLYFAWHETILLWPLREMFRRIPFFAHASGAVYLLQCILMILIMCTILTLLDRLIRRTPLRVMVTGKFRE